MILATRLKLLGSAAIFLLSAGCQAEPNNISDEVNLNEYKIQLVNSASSCLLMTKKDQITNKIELALQPPCYFARKNNSELLNFSYPAQNLEAIVIVIGDPISDEKRKKWNLDKSLICGEKRQALYLSQGNISTSSTTLDGGLACKDTGIDEKDFSHFATEFSGK